MSHPSGQHSGQYGIVPGARDNHHYEQPWETLAGDRVHDEFGRELDDMRTTGQHSGQLGQIPTDQELGLIEVHVYANVDAAVQDANNIDDAEDHLHEVENGIAAITGDAAPVALPAPLVAGVAAAPAIVQAGPIAGHRNDKRRCRTRAFWFIGGILFGGSVGAGATFVSMFLSGWAKAATPNVVNATPGIPGGGPGGKFKKFTPDEETLKLWLMLDDNKLFKVIRDKITAKPPELDLDSINYAVSYMSMIFDGIYPPASNPNYAANLVLQATIDSDYSALKTSGMTILNVFDQSADYPDTDTVDAATVTTYGRGIRLAYLRGMYAKAVVDSMQKPAGT